MHRCQANHRHGPPHQILTQSPSLTRRRSKPNHSSGPGPSIIPIELHCQRYCQVVEPLTSPTESISSNGQLDVQTWTYTISHSHASQHRRCVNLVNTASVTTKVPGPTTGNGHHTSDAESIVDVLKTRRGPKPNHSSGPDHQLYHRSDQHGQPNANRHQRQRCIANGQLGNVDLYHQLTGPTESISSNGANNHTRTQSPFRNVDPHHQPSIIPARQADIDVGVNFGNKPSQHHPPFDQICKHSKVTWSNP